MNGNKHDPRHVFFTRLMWLWIKVCAVLVVIVLTGEWLTPRVASAGLPNWLVSVWLYAVRYALALAFLFCFLALWMFQQRSTVTKKR
jgi:hypothetical protein